MGQGRDRNWTEPGWTAGRCAGVEGGGGEVDGGGIAGACTTRPCLP